MSYNIVQRQTGNNVSLLSVCVHVCVSESQCFHEWRNRRVRVCVCACVRAYVRACKAGIVNENDTRVSSALPGIVTHVMM